MIEINKTQLLSSVKNKRGAIADQLGITRQTFSRRLKNPKELRVFEINQLLEHLVTDTIKIQGTDIHCLEELKSEIQEIKNTVQQKEEQIDKLKHRIFDLQSSITQRKWLIRYKARYYSGVKQDAFQIYEDYILPSNNRVGIRSHKELGSNEWDMINYFQADNVNYIKHEDSVTSETNGRSLISNNGNNVSLVELWDILPDSIDLDVWMECFTETCGGIEKRDVVWREYVGMVDRTECEVLRNIF